MAAAFPERGFKQGLPGAGFATSAPAVPLAGYYHPLRFDSHGAAPFVELPVHFRRAPLSRAGGELGLPGFCRVGVHAHPGEPGLKVEGEGHFNFESNVAVHCR